LPVEQVVADRAGTALSWRITTEVLQFLAKALCLCDDEAI
jgi:hypothetical protein